MLGGKTIGFLGAGNISEAMIRGITEGGSVNPAQVVVTNRADRERLSALHQLYGVRTVAAGQLVVGQADILVVACKPKDAPDLLEAVGHLTRPGQVLLSVMAGVSTAYIESQVVGGVQVVRAMPNTSCQVGESATAMALGSGAGAEAALYCRAILGAVGQVVEVQESLIDAVTGLSGSGPAYIYFMIEAMIEAGKAVGLPGDVARDLSIQTLKGAARVLAETGEDPAVLRQKVTSPNGTTMAGIGVLNECGFSQAVVRAIARATQRSRELGVAASAPRTATG